jgi:hypothetical protein
MATLPFAAGASATGFFNGAPYDGHGLKVSPQAVDLTFTFIGKEAGDISVAFAGVTLFNNLTASGTSRTVSFSLGSDPALVPLSFTDTAPGGGTATNGGPIDPRMGLAFILDGNLPGNTAYAMLDDSGGGPDRDFDDFVIRITARNRAPDVPIPGAALLFGSALAGAVGFGVRRRRKGTAAA